MAEAETKVANPPVAPANEGETIIPTQITSEVVGLDDKKSTSKTLVSIFDKMGEGKTVEQAAEEAMKKKPAEVRQEKKEEKAGEQRQEAQKSELEKKLEADAEKKTETQSFGDEISRESLRKQTEEKKEEKKVEIAPKVDEAITDEELQVMPNDKPKTAKRISALLQKIAAANEVVATTKKEAQSKADKLAELETKLATAKTSIPEEEAAVTAQLDELKMYRRKYDLEKDPEVKSKFDDRITSIQAGIDKPIPDMLRRNGANAELIKLIEDEGGWTKFAESSRVIPQSDGQAVTASELADKIINALPFSDRKLVESAMVEKIQVSREKARYIEEQQKQAKEFFAKQEETHKLSVQQQQKQIQDSVAAIEDFQKKALLEHDFLKEKPIPSDATADVKTAIEQDNAYTKQLQGLLKKSVNVKDMQGALEVVLDSVKYYDERRRTARLQDENKRLRADLQAKDDEIKKFRTGARSTVRSGSIASPSPAAAPIPSAKSRTGNHPLEDVLDQIARGERPGGTVVTTDDND